jgi:general secretion pathway protein J
MPARQAALQPEILVIEGVSGIDLRSHWGPEGWRPGLSIAQLPDAADSAVDSDGGIAAPELYSSALPLAIEVTLHLDGLGSIRLLESLQ